MLFSVAPGSTSRLRLEIANWSASRQLAILTLLCLFDIYLSLFVYIGPEKPQWGVANYIYIHSGNTNDRLSLMSGFAIQMPNRTGTKSHNRFTECMKMTRSVSIRAEFSTLNSEHSRPRYSLQPAEWARNA